MAALALDILQRQVARPDLTELYRYDGYLVVTSLPLSYQSRTLLAA